MDKLIRFFRVIKEQYTSELNSTKDEADVLNAKIKEYSIIKLTVFNLLILFLFVVIVVRLIMINIGDGQRYEQIVLSQQHYDSVTIPYKRGAIIDRNGTPLAYSELVYNLVIDAKLLNNSEYAERLDPTIAALTSCFGLNASEIRSYITSNPNSQYYVVLKELTYDQILPYIEMRDAEDSMLNRSGVWFEEKYKRRYPYDSLACDVIGFSIEDGSGYGLEQYYNDELSGNNGREYGYLTDGNSLERTIIPAEHGNTVVTTIDSYIQRIVEENIIAYNEEHANEFREGEAGSDNTGVIIMDVNTGEVLAMASYPMFNLNDIYDLSAYYTPEEIAQMEQDGTTMEALNAIWKNFCINQSYEPGSVCKTFTVAAGLDLGVVHDSDVYECGGYITYGEGNNATTIRCHQRFGDGELTTKQALEKSCNVALMLMGPKIGARNYLEYFRNFNFGLRTNIDLPGEMRTANLVFNEDTMGVTELATSTFGQGFNVTMIQTISAYCSLVNGGYYYKPHMVRQILDEDGAIVRNIEPELLRQTVSSSVSDLMVDYCIGVVEEGTGTYARPYGYRIGGKTGTAERSGAGKIDYVVSFMGFAPADDPQIAIYVVIDRPNAASQENATRSACILCRSILTDVLPYMNIYMTEELSEDEQEALDAHNAARLEQMQNDLYSGDYGASVSDNSISTNSVSGNSLSGNSVSGNIVEDQGIIISGQGYEVEEEQTDEEDNAWEIRIDQSTGYAIDPLTGEFLDPETGVPIDPNSSIFQTGAVAPQQ